ncbi:vanadium-dependent haloperoxidase [Thalassobacillus sp. CUG 92003]|uniref:vanadium-dependent haloperoxidase n=1 Tax=Thalassobacillus sp. CUG 92003 TaxID=2736641 RepID=UPI0015E72B3A|nr:vanadium-dependent haloperoxidase [Thalassobacillus sp. CUG 92003]
MVNDILYWSDLPYGGEDHPPHDPVDPEAGSWPTFYLTRTGNRFAGPRGPIDFKVRHPDTIDWREQLHLVHETIANLTKKQIQIAKYWGTGPATKQWTPIIDRLIDTYNLTPTRAARVLAAVQAGINDTFVVVWHYKYLWNIARPNQYDPSLAPVLCTPRFPTYVSGHASISGCAETILSYFFPGEAKRLKALAEEDAISRLYGGVHFPIDNDEGLSLGRQIGTIITKELARQRDKEGNRIDTPFRTDLKAELQPPPYTQGIPYEFDNSCSSRTAQTERPHTDGPSHPRLYI